MTEYKATGSCLCGGVKYEITQPPADVHYCHCNMCRKSVGADFATDGAVRKEHFKFLTSDSLQEYHSSENADRCFCGVCGCSILMKAREGGPLEALKYVFVFLGSLDGDPQITPAFHIFAKDRAPWVKIEDGLPKSDGYELMNFENYMK